MKKIFKLLSLLILFLSVSVPLTTGYAQSSLKSIQEKGKLVVGTSADYPPFEWIAIEDGEETIIGADIELAQKIADELGVELVIENMGFDGLIPSLKTNRVDILIAGMGYTPERGEQFDFSNPYYESTDYFVVRADDAEIFTDLESFIDKRLAAQKGSIQEGIVQKEYPDSNYTALAKNNDLIQSLLTNRIDAVMLDEVAAAQFIKQNERKLILVEAFPFIDEEAKTGQSVLVNKNNEDLLEVINKVVDEMVESGEYKDLIEKYIDLI
ncbi:transporter substrate-binding domain-containing protein [Aerococcaceae bacterium WGS1372]